VSQNDLQLQHQPITQDQQAALTQLQAWLPDLNFQLQKRNLPNTVSQIHCLAIARAQEVVGTSNLGSSATSLNLGFAPGGTNKSTVNLVKDYWLVASLPAISQKIIIAVFQEDPKPFIDFIAQLDGLSETADHIAHGYFTAVQHSVLLRRQTHSFILSEVEQLQPLLQLKIHKTSPALSAKAKLLGSSIDEQYQCLLVLFSNQVYSRLEHDRSIELLKIAKTAQKLSDIALSLQSDPSVTDTDTLIDQQSLSNSVPTFENPKQLVADAQLEETQTPSLADLQLLAAHTTRTRWQTSTLFCIFLFISGYAFFFS